MFDLRRNIERQRCGRKRSAMRIARGGGASQASGLTSDLSDLYRRTRTIARYGGDVSLLADEEKSSLCDSTNRDQEQLR